MRKISSLIILSIVFGFFTVAQALIMDLQFEWSYTAIDDLKGFEIAVLDESTNPPTINNVITISDPDARQAVAQVDLLDQDMNFVIRAIDNYDNTSAWSVPKPFAAGQYTPPPAVIDFGPITVVSP